ncbi:biotin--[acetyl-CoA-carboxylase] ligase [Dyadobacter sp. Leaf189]|uniref:biotin--[acetyl-CoA-carboxylase] ligase n=1 Tax=Dyadobacter sp. Leaf189 TaxID=1736295 RepID=UPI0006F7FBC8|nr:biotin--[acetyl-CoA-carboxylase] ligase [Dyadobacter sp. Leaf189]KQS33667.1 biotin--acetyl-CoA-carboxylase ligase [Dyadobacter sp. Leaf189]
MYNSIQDTLIIGKKVIYLPSCHSTNDIAAEIVHAGLFTEGTVVITDHQLSGRGQRGTSWFANPGQNLTFSIVLTPAFLPIQNQFLISQTVALGIKAYLEKYISGVQIKWPNDILVGGKKICGILIENAIQGSKLNTSIVGIGLNINQMNFENDLATSLFIETGGELSLGDEFAALMRCLDAAYLQLRGGNRFTEIRRAYMGSLYGYAQEVKFSYKDRVYTGTVTGVDELGQLSVRLSNGEELTDLGIKEISWIRS